MQLYDFKQVLNGFKNKLDIIQTKQGALEQKIAVIEEKQQSPNFWEDMKVVASVNKELKTLQNKKNALKNVIFEKNSKKKLDIFLTM